jgi:hypothetical protein
MYQDKHFSQGGSRRYRGKKPALLIVALALILTVAVGGTVAYLTTKTDSKINTFTPSQVSCEVKENFDGEKKTNVNVTNTSNIDAFIRVKLVTYRVNDKNQHIGGLAEIPEFTPGDRWVKYGEYYYYTKPVAPGASPAADLISSIVLTGSYPDVDGGKQAIDVMAEAIQAGPEAAVKAAWGDNFSMSGDNLVVPAGN